MYQSMECQSNNNSLTLKRIMISSDITECINVYWYHQPINTAFCVCVDLASRWTIFTKSSNKQHFLGIHQYQSKCNILQKPKHLIENVLYIFMISRDFSAVLSMSCTNNNCRYMHSVWFKLRICYIPFIMGNSHNIGDCASTQFK